MITPKHTPGPITNNLAHDIGEFLLDRHDQFTHWCEDQYAYAEEDIKTIVPKLKAAPAMYEALKALQSILKPDAPGYAQSTQCQQVEAALAQAEGK